MNKNLKINYKNLILSAAIGYQWSELKIFVKSLRKISNDRVILIVANNINEITKKKFNHYNIEYFVNSKKTNYGIAQERYEIFQSILEKLEHKPERILLTDSRDVVFQSNIFNHNFKKPINFFLEKEKILNDPRNTRWLIRTVGTKEFEKIKNKNISCSGTTLGNYDEIIKYADLMKKSLILFPYKRPLRHIIMFKKRDTGYDQGIHNYLIHNNFFKDKECHENEYSKICTTAYMKKFSFDQNKQLVNKKGEIYSIVHQYDRCFEKDGSAVFNFEKIYG